MTAPSICTELHFVFLWPWGFQIVQANPPFAADRELLKENFWKAAAVLVGLRMKYVLSEFLMLRARTLTLTR